MHLHLHLHLRRQNKINKIGTPVNGKKFASSPSPSEKGQIFAHSHLLTVSTHSFKLNVNGKNFAPSKMESFLHLQNGKKFASSLLQNNS